MPSAPIRFMPILVMVVCLIPRLSSVEAGSNLVSFGIISDVHHGLVADAPRRLTAFVAAMREARVDAIVQLGDFCRRRDDTGFLDVWRSFPGPRHMVLGNHDMDGGSTVPEMVAHLGLPAPYYTFMVGGMQGIVLDGNEPGGKARGYRRFIGQDQLAWLAARLAAARHPSCIFVHQPFDDVSTIGIENAGEVRQVLEQAERARPGSIIAVISGHLHEDYIRTIGGIAYIQINSASYYWMSGKGQNMVRYRDPLWGRVAIDLGAGTLTLTGRTSAWEETDPWQRGAEETSCPRERVRPAISDRTVHFPVMRAP